jgi:hypothetical protein
MIVQNAVARTGAQQNGAATIRHIEIVERHETRLAIWVVFHDLLSF